MGIFDFFKQGSQADKLGNALLNTALTICNDDKIMGLVSHWNLTSLELKRYKFNLFILNLSVIINIANTRLMFNRQLLEATLDYVLQNVTRDIVNHHILSGNIKASDIVVYDLERNYFTQTIESNIDLMTDGYSLFDMLFEGRLRIYCAALDKGFEKATQQNNSLSLGDPLSIVFMQFFTGNEKSHGDTRRSTIIMLLSVLFDTYMNVFDRYVKR